MKNINVFVVALLVVLGMSSCSKEKENTVDENPLTNEEVAQFFKNSIQSNSGGLLTNSQNLVERTLKIVSDDAVDCESEYKDDYSFNYDGLFINSNYTSDYIFDFDCNGSEFPNSAGVEASTDYSYLSETMDATSNGIFEGNITGLKTEQEAVILNGSYTHTGKTKTSYINERQFDNTTRINLKELKFDKGNVFWGIPPNVQSGIASVSYIFKTNSGYEYTFDGDIKFTSSRAGEITINGETFPFGF